MDEKQLQQAFIQYLAQKSGAKTEQELQKYIQSLGEEGLKQAQQEFMQIIQGQAQRAEHGAKLQYFRKLKKQCAEDEELVYFKKGGKVDCGCVKKNKTGDKVEASWKENFKARKAASGMEVPEKKKKKDVYFQGEKQTVISLKGKKKPTETEDDKKYNAGEIDQEGMNPNSWKQQKPKQKKSHHSIKMARSPKHEKGGEIKKDCGGTKLVKKGTKVCPKCGKVHAAGMGCAIAAFKNRK